jgi:steroid delta-isomerase-like uncharacterized protein
MATVKNKGIVRRYFEECLNQGNMETIEELIAPTYVSHYPAGYDLGGGPDDVKQIVSSVRRGFPNVHFTIEDFISQGEKVVARWTFHGTHDGNFMGVASTGKEVVVAGVAVYRIADEKIEEVWLSWDVFGLLKQLEVLSP